MGRGPIFPPPGPCLLLVALLLGRCRADAGAADPTLATRLAQALAVPNVDPARTAALAIDLRPGRRLRAESDPLARSGLEQKLPVAYAALLLGPGYRPTPRSSAGHARRRPSGTATLWLRGRGDLTLAPSDLDASPPRSPPWGIRRVDGAVIADDSWFDARRPSRAGALLPIYESPPLSALSVDRGFYRGSTSRNPALAAGSLLRQFPPGGGRHRGPSHSHGVSPRPRASRWRATSPSRSRTSSASWAARATTTPPRSSSSSWARSTRAAARPRRAPGSSVPRSARQVPLAGVRLADGSGLSGLDRLTAAALVALLEAGLGQRRIPRGVPAVARRRGRQRDARGADGEAAGARPGDREDGDDAPASALSGFVRDRYVFADPPERAADLGVLGAARAGSLRCRARLRLSGVDSPFKWE